jgi:zinc transport system substrate-binding protein
MIRYFIAVILLLPLLVFDSCNEKHSGQEKLQLTVSIIPQKYLARIIAGDKFDVQVMLPPGSNHETYEPAPRDMEKISKSELYLALGALDFELAWLERLKASNPALKIVNTSEGIEMISGHSHENGKQSEHQGLDPHTWLSVSCMKIQATNINKALAAKDAADSSYFKDNLTKFKILADSLDKIIRKTLSSSKGKSVLIFHPALAYFARDYGLTQISIEQDGKEPSPSYMAELIKIARQKQIKAIFISKEFDTRNAEAIAPEIGAKVVVIDPMDENWPVNMIRLAQLIAKN